MSGRIRTRVLAAVIGVVALITTMALAQAPITTSLDPLSRLLDSLTGADDVDGISQDGSGTIAGQFQTVVHFGSGFAFGVEGGELIPRGYSADGVLEDLSDVFGGSFTQFSTVPPLDPSPDRGGELDPADIGLEGWSLFGERGPVDTIDIGETPTVIWGVELTEPFDTTCASPRAVGRTWTGVFLGDPEPSFSLEELTNAYGASHAPLEGQYSRVAQLTCFTNGEPSVLYNRMSDDSGIRNLSPNKITAAVDGNHVLFFMPTRHVDEDIYGAAYADDGAEGEISLSPWNTDPVTVLLPNPYADLPVRITLQITIEEAFRYQPDSQGETLGFTPGSGHLVLAGTDCAPKGSVIYTGPLVTTPQLVWWLAGHSESGFAALVEDEITIEMPNDFGGIDTIVVNQVDRTFTIFRTVGEEGPAEEVCEGTGTATIEGDPATAGGGDSDGPEDTVTTPTEAPDDGDAIAVDPAPTDDTGGGPPVVAIIVGLVVIVGGVAYVRTRGRGNCHPEELAHTQALHVAEAAKLVLEEKEAERHTAQGELNALRTTMQRLDIPGPVEPYPLTPDSEARYRAELAEYEAEQATRAEVESDLAAAETRAAEATQDRDHALERYDSAIEAMWAAYHALRECRERNGGSVPPPPDVGGVPIGGDDGSSGGGTTPGGVPPETPTQPEQQGCKPGTTEWREESKEDFTSPGDTTLDPSRGGATWARFIASQGGGIDPDVFAAMDSQIDELSADVDTGEGVFGDNITVTATIEVVEIEVVCERLYRCNPQTGEMEATDTVRARQSQTVRTDRIVGEAGDSARMAAFARQIQAKVRAHQASAKALEEFRCE